MNNEIYTNLVALQAHLISSGDNDGLRLFDNVRQAIKQHEEWEKLTIWLADCQAATAEGYAHRKSASKSEKKRHASICASLQPMIENGYFTGRMYGTLEEAKKRVLDRLKQVVTRLESTPEDKL